MSDIDDAASLAQQILSATYPRVALFDYDTAEKRDPTLRLARAVLALRAENAAMREALGKSETENARRRDLLVDVFDLWDDNAIEHSTPDNYQRAKLVFGWIFDELPPEKQAAILGRRVPDA